MSRDISQTIDRDLQRDDLPKERDNVQKVQRDIVDKKEREKNKPDKDLNIKKNRENVLDSISKNIDRIEKQGFERPLLDDLKKHSNEVILDVRNVDELRDFADKNFSKEGKENLENILNIRYNVEKERPGYETVKEYAILTKMEKMEKDGIKVVKDHTVTPEKIQGDLSKIVDKIEDMKVREGLEHRIQIEKDIKISKAVICDTRYNNPSRERYTSEKEKEKTTKSFWEREAANKYKENVDYLDRWGYERDSSSSKDIDREIEKDRERAVVLEKVIKEMNISPVVENYILNLQKDELQNVLLEVNTREDYEHFLDKVVDSVKEEDKEAIRDELYKNELQQMAFWKQDDRAGGQQVDLNYFKGPKTGNEKEFFEIREHQEQVIKDYIKIEKHEISKIADRQSDGRYVFSNEKDNFLGRIDNVDKIKATAAIHLAMISRDEKGSKDFIRNNIDSRISVDKPDNVRTLVKEITSDIRQSRDNAFASRTLVTNGQAVRFEKDYKEEMEQRHPYNFHKHEPTGIFKVEERDFANKVHRGNLEDLARIKSARDYSRAVEKHVDKLKDEKGKNEDKNKSLKEIEKEKTSKMIELLAKDERIVNKFSSRTIETELVKDVGKKEFGPKIEKEAYIAYQIMRFSKDEGLKESIEKRILSSKESSLKEERALYECFKQKTEITTAFIRGELESIEADIRFNTKDTIMDIEGMSYTGRESVVELEKDIREMVIYRATHLPNIKNERLEILLDEKNKYKTIKKLEKSLGRSIKSNEELKMQVAIQSNRMQEIIQRTALAMRSDDKDATNAKVNSFLNAKLAEENAGRDGKLLKGHREEMYNNISNFVFYTSGREYQNFNAISNPFDFFNSSMSRDYMITGMRNQNQDIMEGHFRYNNQEAGLLVETELPKGISEINSEYLLGMVGRFGEAGINLDPRITTLIANRNDSHTNQEITIINKETFDYLRNSSSIYKENSDGTFRTLTMGDVSRSEIERIDELFNKMFDEKAAMVAYGTTLRPADALEVLARGESTYAVLQNSPKSFDDNVYKNEIELFKDIYSKLDKEVERSFKEAVQGGKLEFLGPPDSKFKDCSYREMIDKTDDSPFGNRELRAYYLERIPQVRDALIKEDFAIQRERARVFEDVSRGIQDRKNKFDTEKEITRLELNRAGAELIKMKKDKDEAKAYNEEIRAMNKEKVAELKAEYDNRAKEISKGPFGFIESLSLKVEKYKTERELNAEIEKWESFISQRESELPSDERIKETGNRVEVLKSVIKTLEVKSSKHNLDDRIDYVKEKLREEKNRWHDHELSLRVHDFIKDKPLEEIITYKDVLSEDKRLAQLQNYKVTEKERILLKNRPLAFEARYKSLVKRQDFDERYENYKQTYDYQMYQDKKEVYKANQKLDTMRSITEKQREVSEYLQHHDVYIPFDATERPMAEFINREAYMSLYIQQVIDWRKLDRLYNIVNELKYIEERPDSEERTEAIKSKEQEIENWKYTSFNMIAYTIQEIREVMDYGKPYEQMTRFMKDFLIDNEMRENILKSEGGEIDMESNVPIWVKEDSYEARVKELKLYEDYMADEEYRIQAAIESMAPERFHAELYREDHKPNYEAIDYDNMDEINRQYTYLTNRELEKILDKEAELLEEKIKELQAEQDARDERERLEEEKLERERQMTRLEWLQRAKIEKEESEKD